MSIVMVNSTAQLVQALSQAQSGEIIKLAPGVYSGVNIQNLDFASPVTITSAQASHPATITDLTVYGSTGLSFANLELSTAGAVIGPYGPGATTEYNFANDSHISINRLNVHGDPNGTLATDVSGFLFENCNAVVVANSRFTHLHNAINDIGCSDLRISNNTFTHIWDDGIRGGASSNVLIKNNYFTDMHEDPTDPDHPDCIQFWTTNTTASAHDITILNNTYSRGDGGAVQGIFLNDEVGNLPYLKVNIAFNSLSGSLWNGITINDGLSSAIRSNVITSYTDQTSWIRVDNSSGIKIVGNAAVQYLYNNDTNLTISGNFINSPIPPPDFRVGATAGGPNAALMAAHMASLSLAPSGAVGAGETGSVQRAFGNLAAPSAFLPEGGGGVGAD